MRKGLIALCVLGSLPAHAEPLVRLSTSYFYVDGPSAAVLAGQLEQVGPVGADGKRHPSKTRWDAQWRFRNEQKGTTCSIKEVAVAVGITQTMPKWRGEDKGSAGLKAAWTKFVDALQRYEDSHKENGMKAAREIEKALSSAKPASNCEDLQAAANATAQAIVEKYQALDDEYDRKTDHGRSQGASLL